MRHTVVAALAGLDGDDFPAEEWQLVGMYWIVIYSFLFSLCNAYLGILSLGHDRASFVEVRCAHAFNAFWRGEFWLGRPMFLGSRKFSVKAGDHQPNQSSINYRDAVEEN